MERHPFSCYLSTYNTYTTCLHSEILPGVKVTLRRQRIQFEVWLHYNAITLIVVILFNVVLHLPR